MRMERERLGAAGRASPTGGGSSQQSAPRTRHKGAAKQTMTAGKLRHLQERFSGANVVRKKELLPEEAVTFGKRVRIRETKTGNTRECKILGDGEADPDQGIIAYNSPLASALIGHKKGDVVEVRLPVG